MEQAPSTQETAVSNSEKPSGNRAEIMPLYQRFVIYTPYVLAGFNFLAVILGFLNHPCQLGSSKRHIQPPQTTARKHPGLAENDNVGKNLTRTGTGGGLAWKA
jgi:hypothetical protein